MLRADLTAAGIPYHNRDGFADFHALRHTYVTLLAERNPPKVVQSLARHKTPTLTLSYYTHLRDSQRVAAVEGLPVCLHGACTDDGNSRARKGTVGNGVEGSNRQTGATKNPGNPAESAAKPG